MATAVNTVANGGELITPEPGPGPGHHGVRPRGRHRDHHAAPGGERRRRPQDRRDDGAGHHPGRRHRARRRHRGLPRGRQDRHRPGGRRRVQLLRATAAWTSPSPASRPADKPRFTVYVVVKHPQAGASGGGTAGPVFRKILSYVLQKYAVAPTGTTPPHDPDPAGDRSRRPRRCPATDEWPLASVRVLSRTSPARAPRPGPRSPRWPPGPGPSSRPPTRADEPVEVTGLSLSSQRVQPGRPVRRPAGQPGPRGDVRREAVAAGARGRPHRRGGRAAPSATPRCRCSSSTTRAPCSGPSPRGCTASRPRALTLMAVTGTQGKTTTTRLLEGGARRRRGAAQP